MLQAPGLEELFPELLLLGRTAGWRFHTDRDAVELTIGGAEPVASLSGFVRFLRGVLDPRRLADLQAAWLDPTLTADHRLAVLEGAHPLVSMVPQEASKLIDILEFPGGSKPGISRCIG